MEIVASLAICAAIPYTLWYALQGFWVLGCSIINWRERRHGGVSEA